jgi:DNA-binding SARP family transcriptional activator/Tfp pilus assembly protein PilF
MIKLQVLGSFDVRDAQGRPVEELLTQPKRAALLCYLALARPVGLQRRDTLTALFWPELDQARARGALRQALYRIRQALGEDAIVSRGTEEVGVAPAAVGCDAVHFETAAMSGDAASAVALYRGHLLPGFFIDAAPEFDHWLDNERARLRRLAGEAAWALSEAHAHAGTSREAVRYARQAVEFLEAEEQSVRRLMKLLDQLDDRAAAVRAYDDFAQMLEAQFGLEPSEETQVLLAELRGRRAQIVHVDAPPRVVEVRIDQAKAPHGRRVPQMRAAVIVTLLISMTSSGHMTMARTALTDEARRAFLEGKYFASQFTEASLKRAITRFQTTIRDAPTYPDAHVELGRAHMMLALAHGVKMSTEALSTARRAADEALRLDPRSAEAHDLRALIAEYDWDWQAAKLHHQRALELDPHSATLWQNDAQFLNTLGLHDDAIKAIEKAATLDPLSKIIRADAAVTYWMAGDFENADRWAQRALDLDSLFHPALWVAGEVSIARGDTARGLNQIARAAAIARTPGFTGLLGVAYARTGRTTEARAISEQLQRADEAAPWVALNQAMISAWLGDRDSAFLHLHRAVAMRDPNLPWSIKQNPGYDPLRTDPRFAAILDVIALP